MDVLKKTNKPKNKKKSIKQTKPIQIVEWNKEEIFKNEWARTLGLWGVPWKGQIIREEKFSTLGEEIPFQVQDTDEM